MRSTNVGGLLAAVNRMTNEYSKETCLIESVAHSFELRQQTDWNKSLTELPNLINDTLILPLPTKKLSFQSTLIMNSRSEAMQIHRMASFDVDFQ